MNLEFLNFFFRVVALLLLVQGHILDRYSQKAPSVGQKSLSWSLFASVVGLRSAEQRGLMLATSIKK